MPSGKSRLKSSDDINAELALFESENPASKLKISRILGAISSKMWRDVEPSEVDYEWLQKLVSLKDVFIMHIKTLILIDFSRLILTGRKFSRT